MKRQAALASPLAERIVEFIAFKRLQGYDYADRMNRLRRFDAFLSETGCAGRRLRTEDLDRYRAEIGGLQSATQAGNLSTVRQFSLYLHAREPESAVLPARLLPRQPRPIRFRPLSPDQVGDLMAATVRFNPEPGIGAQGLRFLIGLLYSTGLRSGEALALNLGDVDARQATLFVRRGKFRKERLVPMSPSTLEALNQWLARRACYAGNEASSPLLVARWNTRLDRRQASNAFARLCVHCGIDGDPPPRLHDLRHNYACRRLALWREAQEDVDAMLPVLANAMGHVDFRSTQVYIHIDAAALQQASAKFREHAHPCLEPST
jgi:integrase